MKLPFIVHFWIFLDIFCFFLLFSDGISEEIELLKAIYVHELEIHGPEERLKFNSHVLNIILCTLLYIFLFLKILALMKTIRSFRFGNKILVLNKEYRNYIILLST